MEALVWIGAAVCLGGLAGLAWCIIAVARARRSALSQAEMGKALRRAVTVNLAAFLTSSFGLILVLTGLLLG